MADAPTFDPTANVYSYRGERGMEKVRALADRLQLPVRVIAGGGRCKTPEQWRGVEIRRKPPAFETLDAFNEAGGITIVSYGTMSPARAGADMALPEALFEREDQRYVYDVLRLNGETGYNAVEVDDVVLGEFAENVLVFHATTLDGYRLHYVNLETLASLVELTVNEELAAQLRVAKVERDRQRFVDQVTGRLDRGVEDARQIIGQHEHQLVTAQQQAEQARARLVEEQEKLDLMLARREEGANEERILAEWEALQRHAKITEVTWITPTILQAKTDLITVPLGSTGEPIPIGEFAVKMDFAQPSVTFHNLTDQRNGRDHPHITNGRMCTGEVGPNLDRLLREKQVGAAMNLAIRSLGTYHPADSYGRYLEWWQVEPGRGSNPPEENDEATA